MLLPPAPPEVLQPSFDPAAKPSPRNLQSCMLGLSWSHWSLSLQMETAWPLGEEELAELQALLGPAEEGGRDRGWRA